MLKNVISNVEIYSAFARIHEAAVTIGFKILSALVVFIIGRLIIKWLVKLTSKFMSLKKSDPALVGFTVSIENMLLIVLLALMCVKIVGIDITPLLTAIGAVGLAVSLAVKSSLSNLAGGVFIFIAKPFRAGDDVDIKGCRGSVFEIRMLHTVLSNENGLTFIPNGDVSSSVIINYSKIQNQPGSENLPEQD